MAEEKKLSRNIIGKTIVSKSGKKFGEVGDIVFESRTGELIYLTLKGATPHASKIELEKGKEGDLLIPFSSVIAVGDFVVIGDEDIV